MLCGASEDFIVPVYLPVVVKPSNKCPPSNDVGDQGPILTWFTWLYWPFLHGLQDYMGYMVYMVKRCVQQGQHLVNG